MTLALSTLALTNVQIGLAAAMAIIVFVAAMRFTELGVACILVTIPMQDAAAVAAGGATVTWTKVVVASAVAGWGLHILADKSLLRFDIQSVAFIGCVLALMVSVVNAEDLSAWAGEVYRWSVALIVYLMATSALHDRRSPHYLVGAVAIATIGTSIVGMVQVLLGSGPPSFEAHGITRAYGAFGEPNPYAGYLEMTVPLLAAIFIGMRRSQNQSSGVMGETWFSTLVAGGAGLGSLALVLSQSRGGLLGFAVGMAVVLFLAGGWPRKAVLVVGISAAALVPAPFVWRTVHGTVTAGTSQLVTPANFAVAERIAHWRTGLAMGDAYPVFGVGAGNFSARYREFAQVWRFRISRGHAHNTYIQVMAQSGLVGLGCYLTLLGAVMLRLIRAYQRVCWQAGGVLVVGALGVTSAVIVHGMFDYLHVLSLGLQLSAVWALANMDWPDPDGAFA